MTDYLNEWSHEWHEQASTVAQTIFKTTLHNYIDSANPNVTFDLVEKYPEYKWNLCTMQDRNPNITWPVISSSNFDWDYDFLTRNPAIPLSVIRRTPHLNWDLVVAEARDPLTTWDKIQKVKTACMTSSSPRIVTDEWTYALSDNPNVWTILNGHLPYNLDTWALAAHPDTSWEEIDRLSETDLFCWHIFGTNPNVTWEDICTRSTLNWDYKYISMNPNITFDIVKKNPDKEWNYWAVCAKPDVTWDTVLDNPDFPWDYNGLSHNPNIDWSIVLENPHHDWKLRNLCSNPMDRARDEFIRNKHRKSFIEEDGMYEEMMAVFWHPDRYHKFGNWL